ncbi:IucA/IucC family protein [Amycolatopsis cihanbeyliensis]|uniref:Siderophore synthetase component n=1 Tax=Amycolatopsis cihanbeyliensis TaxID=1128664 RepID=A0A542DND8_AMYCI|nr:IucA/IucC family protein [Amycolatopsis cihanbeyliensis]TQJ04619.1 siderophore synthetase component [Amycolatopsis cihanbeyliensis]
MNPGELVMRDLVDALIQENLFGFAEGRADTETGHYEVAAPGPPIRLLVRDGGALQRHRFAGGPVRHGDTELTPDALLRLLAADSPHGARVAADLRTAVEHAEVTLTARRRFTGPGGERLAATRDRPFHPTARAAVGWAAAELAEYGPMRRESLALAWVAVPADLLRFGGGPGSADLPAMLLTDHDRDRLAEALRGLDGWRALPVHPWQLEHVLPREFPANRLRPLPRAGRFHPTAALRTLGSATENGVHVKLPLGIATLGAARLLPPRYLDNGERAERTMRTLLAADPLLRHRVALCDERTWCGWHAAEGDEFADRPGQLAAQVRRYPPIEPDALALPMAALAAHEWDHLSGLIDREPVAFFTETAEIFLKVALGFLRYGVLPELHGQNVVLVLRAGSPVRLVLRDHDTLRLHPAWMAAAGVPDPGYRVKPGAPQSLRLDSPAELLGYLQTLGIQVNLYGIADALARHLGIAEGVFWRRIRTAITGALDTLELPGHLANLVKRRLLDAPHWPSRQVLGPLLREGSSTGVSMPASTGQVPNPLVRA